MRIGAIAFSLNKRLCSSLASAGIALEAAAWQSPRGHAARCGFQMRLHVYEPSVFLFRYCMAVVDGGDTGGFNSAPSLASSKSNLIRYARRARSGSAQILRHACMNSLIAEPKEVS